MNRIEIFKIDAIAFGGKPTRTNTQGRLTPRDNYKIIPNNHYTKYKFLRVEKDLSEEQFVAGVLKNILSVMST
jgi:hypothetical protein